jgi:hypothetical protein
MSTLTARQARAIEALLSVSTIGEAAKIAGVSRRTLERWRQDATFCDALRHAGDERIAAISRRLAGLGDVAVNTLRDAMNGGDGWPVRVRAADVVLARLMQLRELTEIEERIAALEVRYADKW